MLDLTDTAAFDARLRAKIDGKTKPVGSLGRIEDLAAQIARLQRSLAPRMDTCALTIFAADHGIAAAGVSAYPQAVTREMVRNFLAGGAASTVFAATLGVTVRVVDAGVAGDPLPDAELLSRRIAPGTASFLDGPAMTCAQCDAALAEGRALGGETPMDAAAFGEMGIANTAAAAAVAHKLTGLPLAILTGRGTGLDDAGLRRKIDVLTRAAARTATTLSPEAVLAEYGGFEIAMMAGAMIGAAEAGKLVRVDGFIATVAALVAIRLAPGIPPALVFAHVSHEAGHRPLLDRMEVRPLLSLDMRLGEGTGALLAWPLARAAAAMLRDMASFESAGVSRA